MKPDASATVAAALVAIAYRWYAEVAFGPEISKRRSQGWTRQSWWQVIGISFGFFLGLLLLVVVALAISETLRSA